MINSQNAALAERISEYPPVDEENEKIESMLTKFVVVCEWIDGQGNRYLTKRSSDGTGEAIPGWDVKGLLHEGLFGDFDS